MSYYSRDELDHLNLGFVGRDVKLSRNAALYNPRNISIGDYSRIDDFCVLSAGEGGIRLGRNVHVAAYALLVGKGAIVLEDFAGLSSRVCIYSSSDDYSGKSLTNPTVDARYSAVVHGPVVLGKHVIVGSGTVILPNVTIGEGAAIGALSLVAKNCEPFFIYSGMPLRRLKRRSRDLLNLESEYRKEFPSSSA